MTYIEICIFKFLRILTSQSWFSALWSMGCVGQPVDRPRSTSWQFYLGAGSPIRHWVACVHRWHRPASVP